MPPGNVAVNGGLRLGSGGDGNNGPIVAATATVVAATVVAATANAEKGSQARRWHSDGGGGAQIKPSIQRRLNERSDPRRSDDDARADTHR